MQKNAVTIRDCAALALLLTGATANAELPAEYSAEDDAVYATAWEPVASADTAGSGALIEEMGVDAIPLLPARDLEELVGPVALYPDKLLAIVLPAAAYPLQIVQAARFLDELESDPTLVPSTDWDESVVALLNYPEVLRLLNEDIDWTLMLGEAVIAQQDDVIAAVQRFRDRAYLAGNLASDERQNVIHADRIIEIEPVSESTIYVPVYKPESVVRHTVHPVYTYHPDPYPVYYYPYPDGYAFRNGFFWGVTSAYALGWRHSRLRVIHHSFAGHPYYGYRYGWRWWYRRPTLVYHNNLYYRPHRSHLNRAVVRNQVGDYWVPRHMRRAHWAGDRNRIRTYDGASNVTRQNSRPYPVEANRRPARRPSIGSVERSLREQGTRRSDRVMTPATAATRRPQTQSSQSLPSRSRTINSGRSATTPGISQRSSSSSAYRRSEPRRLPSSVPRESRSKYSTRPAPTRQVSPPRTSTRSATRSSTRSSSPPAATRQSTRQQPQSVRRSTTNRGGSTRSRERH